jgi:aerobic carbon-monoxide dehydrogenase large subunit
VTTAMVGAPIPRGEDPRLLRGEGRFLDDLTHDALAMAIVRSPHAHARITGIDVDDALDVDGLVAIYTYDDLPPSLQARLPVLIPHPTLTHARTQHVLAKARSTTSARRSSPSWPATATSPRTPCPAHPGRLRGAARRRRRGHRGGRRGAGGARRHPRQRRRRDDPGIGDPDGAIAGAPHVLDLHLEIERSASTPLETRGVHAHRDPVGGKLLVHSSTQAPTSVRAAIASLLELPFGDVEVVCPDIGGGFGVKIMHPWPEELLVPWATLQLDHDVAFVEDRREHFVSANHERGQVHDVRVGFDDEGRILGMTVDFVHDHGAYIPYGLIVPIITSTQLLGPYRMTDYRATFRSVYTNTTPVTPYRGAGRPQGCFVMERTMDAIARELGRDRTAVRAANFIQPDEFPYEYGLTFQDGRAYTYDSGDFPASLALLKDLVGWDDFPALKAEAEAEGRLLGIGLATYVEGTGVGPYEGGHVLVEPTGKVQVATGLSTQGQGHQTVFAQIVADRLGVAFEDVTSSPATPGASATRSGRSPRGPR